MPFNLFSAQNKIKLTTSETCIQDHHWVPLPNTVPKPKTNGQYKLAITPPCLPKTIPSLTIETSIPSFVAEIASFSQSKQTPERNCVPFSDSSSRIFFSCVCG